MTWRVDQADCIEAMRAMDEASVDAIVCDPPYGLGFMGKDWDQIGDTGRGARARVERADEVTSEGEGHSTSAGPYLAAGVDSLRSAGAPYQAWSEAWAREALRVLKPGGHLLAFGGTRTYHRLACAIEDAGLEIRDTIAWLYGSGFPKSLDVSKAIDKAHGEQGKRGEIKSDRHAAMIRTGRVGAGKHDGWNREAHTDPDAIEGTAREYVPATDDAERWQGHGTALKPAHEPIVLARKPLAGSTVAANVLEHGTGALNIDGCRIEMSRTDAEAIRNMSGYGRADYTPPREGVALEGVALEGSVDGSLRRSDNAEAHRAGRWPANVALDDEAAETLDQSVEGRIHSAGHERERQGPGGYDGSTGIGFGAIGTTEKGYRYGDSGGASRFFYVAKASRAEREAGLAGPAAGRTDDGYGSIQTPTQDRAAPREHWQPKPVRNNHPTVKPLALMRWLVRLACPPGGVVLDPFCGSGTTGCACVLEGLDFVGLEREAEYVEIARARIAWWADPAHRPMADPADPPPKRGTPSGDDGQLDLGLGEEAA